MSIISGRFYAVQCDCCGNVVCDIWSPEKGSARLDFIDEGGLELDGNNYCHACYTIDDEDNIYTKDGKVYNDKYELVAHSSIGQQEGGEK